MYKNNKITKYHKLKKRLNLLLTKELKKYIVKRRGLFHLFHLVNFRNIVFYLLVVIKENVAKS